jgi:hypothetical protein
MAERDPDIVVMWLRQRVDPAGVPEQPVVLELDIGGTLTMRQVPSWFRPSQRPTEAAADVGAIRHSTADVTTESRKWVIPPPVSPFDGGKGRGTVARAS